MTPQVRVLLFIVVVAFVFVTAANSLIAILVRRLRKTPPVPDKLQLWVMRGSISLAAIGVICILYGYFVEPYWPEVTHVQIKTKKFTQGSKPIRIVHISDIHSDPKKRLEPKLPSLIAAEHPDLIVFSGDASNSRTGDPVFRELMGELTKVAPVFASLGNWDVRENIQGRLYEATNVTVLNGDAIPREFNGHQIWIGGMSVDTEFWLRNVFKKSAPEEFHLLVFHYPDRVDDAVNGGTDLYCAGHTHGGQVALPFYGALITFSQFDKRFEAGLYDYKGMRMYVNRGIGMEGAMAPRVRFMARPEITVIDVVAE